jgi:hypothetical protein
MKKLTLIGIMVFILTSSASAEAGWRSNVFVSPTRNIHCQYYPYGPNFARGYAGPTIACMTLNNRREVALRVYGGRGFEVYNWPDPIATPFTHVLYYGQTYIAQRLQCMSNFTNMSCRSSYGHGFSINRDSIQTW